MSTAPPISRPAQNASDQAENPRPGRIVAIDDDPLTRLLLKSHLEKAGFAISTAENGSAGLELIDDSVAVALVDLSMPDMNGFEVLEAIHKINPGVSVIILTSSNDVNDAVLAMRLGAFQFVTKPFEPEQLLVFVEKAIEHWAVTGENRGLKEFNNPQITVQVPATGSTFFRLKKQIDRIANLDSTVFIGGESGTGKSTVSRLIHQKSNRAAGPFVTVNCSSLPRDLIQSELFGHTKGAFTGAVRDRIGHAEVADGGTLFLDEIGDLPLELQPKLLTFLQDRTVQRLGSTDTRKVDVRLITATHRDLAALCREGLFRQDLYYRLLVLSMELPPLRQRIDELENLVRVVLKRICERQQIDLPQVSRAAMKILQAHHWPGNIRELENVLERATAYLDSHIIQPKDLIFGKPVLSQAHTTSYPEPSQPPVNPTSNLPAPVIVSVQPSPSELQPISEAQSAPITMTGYTLVGKTMEQIERDAIIQTLESTGGNKAKAARTLGICEKTIYNKMKRLNIDRTQDNSPKRSGVTDAFD